MSPLHFQMLCNVANVNIFKADCLTSQRTINNNIMVSLVER